MKSYSFVNQLLSNTTQDGITLALKSEIDFQHGRNEELRTQILQLNAELRKSQLGQAKAQDEIDRLTADIRLMSATSGARDIFKPFKLPEGISPSSQDVISALNEYLIDTLQELDEYRRVCTRAEQELEALKRKFSVSRHQMGLLYKDYGEEKKNWKAEREKFEGGI
jgi:centrosomal protein CEP290